MVGSANDRLVLVSNASLTTDAATTHGARFISAVINVMVNMTRDAALTVSLFSTKLIYRYCSARIPQLAFSHYNIVR